MSIEIPINVNMEVEESQMAFNMEVDEDINVTVIQGTDVSDTTAVEADVLSGKKFHKANGDLATGSLVLPVSVPPNDVNFIDYDGTIVASYSASDFANLSAMPDNPTHTGLTAQGWNWTLADAKAQVAVSGQIVIGQMYVTSDGKTRIYISIPNALLCEVKLNWAQTVANGVTIDWGDGTATETFSGTGNKSTSHTYASTGEYCIALNPTSGTLTLSSSVITGTNSPQASKDCVYKVELGTDIEIGASAFYVYHCLRSISIPKEITSFGNTSLYSEYSLRGIVIPQDVTNAVINLLRYSYSLEWLSLPKKVTTFGDNCFGNINSLKTIVFPSGTLAIPVNALTNCQALVKMVIPSTVTSIGATAFSGCSSLQEIHFKPTTPPTVANANAFTNVPTTCKIYVPSGYKSAYTSASNYPSASSYTYIEE